MASDPIKCLAAAHLPLTGRKEEDADWFDRVDALARDVREIESAARASERAKVLDAIETAAKLAPNGYLHQVIDRLRKESL